MSEEQTLKVRIRHLMQKFGMTETIARAYVEVNF